MKFNKDSYIMYIRQTDLKSLKVPLKIVNTDNMYSWYQVYFNNKLENFTKTWIESDFRLATEVEIILYV